MNISYNTDNLNEIDRLARTYLDLKKWEFIEKGRITGKFPAIAYQSKWCLVRLVWAGMEMQGGYTLGIDYGRLHAPIDNSYMVWNGENCHCWHNISYVLHFLDGNKPINVAGKNYKRPQIIEEFRKSDIGQNLKDHLHQPEWITRLHNTIWDHYGNRLFELFDLKKPKLWDTYRQFIKAVYDIERHKPNIQPPLDNIC